jgi:hypothetical protein
MEERNGTDGSAATPGHLSLEAETTVSEFTR